MAKSRITDEQGMRQLNVKLPPEDSEFVQNVLRPQLNVPYNADALREVISQLRTWFRLPAYVGRGAQGRRRCAEAPRTRVSADASAYPVRGPRLRWSCRPACSPQAP